MIKPFNFSFVVFSSVFFFLVDLSFGSVMLRAQMSNEVLKKQQLNLHSVLIRVAYSECVLNGVRYGVVTHSKKNGLS